MIKSDLILKSSQIKKANRDEVFDAVLNLIDIDIKALNPLEEKYDSYISLLSFFTPKSKKQTGQMGFIEQACSIDDSRIALHYILVNDEHIVATDGKRLHIADNKPKLMFDDKFPTGLYQNGKLVKTDISSYPKYKQALGFKHAKEKVITINDFTIETSNDNYLVYCITLDDIIFKFNADFLLEAFAGSKEVVMSYGDNIQPVLFINKKYRAKAIVMPVKFKQKKGE